MASTTNGPWIPLLLILSSCSLGGGPAPGPAEGLSGRTPARPAPVSCPPRALAGLTLCLDPLPAPEERKTQAAALYLARLLEKSGARVGLTRFTRSRPFPAPGKDLERALALAAKGGAELLLRISETTPAPLPPARDLLPRETGLARFLKKEQALGGEKARVLPLPLQGKTLKAALWVILPGGAPLPPGGFRAHRPPAQALYRAILAWWKSLGIPAPPRRKPSLPWPLSSWEKRPPTKEAARLLLQAWQKGKALDPTQGWLQVEVEREGPRWALLGSSEFPGLARAAGALLEAAGFRPLENRVRLLPDGAAGNPPYGVFRAARALTWARPGEASGLSAADGPGQVEETELLFGDPLRVLDKQKGFLLVHAASGYLGWVEEEAVLRCSEKRFLSLLAAPRALFLKSYRRGDVEVPAGAALPFRGKKGDLVLLETPRGGILPVPSRWVKLSDPSRGEAAAALALSALGTPYLFGGRDREEGIDCSGLVQACWAAQGVRLPRDARMQVLCGRLVGWKGKWEALRPGDVLFFMNRWGRISHVALSLGGSRFVHATPPEVTIGSLDPADPWYTPTARRFVLAKRIRL